MDMIQTALETSGDKDCECEDDKVALTQRLAIVEEDGAVRDTSSPILAQSGFALRSESEHSGAVAYRVVQFGTDGGVDAIPQGAVQNTVPNLLTATQMNGSPSDSSETRLALITSDVPTDGNSAVVVSGGQFYVISDVLTNTAPRSLTPRTSESMMSQRLTGTTREEKRRVTHNEVERRRRDKINNWICRLAKIIPDCPDAHPKSAQLPCLELGEKMQDVSGHHPGPGIFLDHVIGRQPT
ncbi:upstream stimulatory factor-like isoform X2 [Penaeus japonicus]|uniref:upstream stimulatory factor-like isoform X2 n=1 Tax=Penaeus japonicus TaxID=27405 RepID=UPI001C70B27C|nr:upstream stimulatory factor-like isoform X2 [Penaeus japonicus]